MARRRTARLSWWLERGEEPCGFCHGSYVYEREVRCLECDAPICPDCVVVERRRHVCPGCAPPARRRGGGGRA